MVDAPRSSFEILAAPEHPMPLSVKLLSYPLSSSPVTVSLPEKDMDSSALVPVFFTVKSNHHTEPQVSIFV